MIAIPVTRILTTRRKQTLQEREEHPPTALSHVTWSFSAGKKRFVLRQFVYFLFHLKDKNDGADLKALTEEQRRWVDKEMLVGKRNGLHLVK